MHKKSFYTSLMLLVVMILVTVSCSTSKSPVEPAIDNLSVVTDSQPASGNVDAPERTPIAVYEAVIDPDNETFTVTPVDRVTQFHFPLLDLHPNALEIVNCGFSPNMWVDIKLKHPLLGSGIDVFDPRVIFIVPANPGKSFIYPEFDITGNNRVIIEPDGYTGLFNDLGGSIAGNANPFVAYFKDQSYRRWSSMTATEETKRIQMDIDGFVGPMEFVLVVDISTNHPHPPRPIVDNASEPYEIDAEIGEGLTSQGGTADVEVRLKHWQDLDDIGDVLIESPSLFNNVMPIQYYSYSPHYDASIYKGSISNMKLAPQGMHSLMVKSSNVKTSIEMFNEFHANVQYLNPGGNLMWAKNAAKVFLNTLGMPPITTGITAVADDSFVMMGTFWESATFGEGEPNETKLIGSEARDIFIAKYNLDGSFIWASAALETSSQAITSLPDNSTVITGDFRDTATFGPGEPNETTLEAVGNNVFIARYYPDGTLAWAKQAGGEDWSGANAVTALSDNSILITGSFRGTAIFGKGESNETHLFSPGKYAMFIARYNTDGTLAWAEKYGAVSGGYAIATLSDDSMIVTGSYLNPSTGKRDIAVARCNPDGSIEWISLAGGDNLIYAYAVTVLSHDSAVVTGRFAGSIIFGKGEPNETTLISAGGDDTFIARYNPDGTLHWANRAGGSSNNRGNDITSLSDNSIVVTGSYRDKIIFGEGEPNETILSDRGVFIAGYNPDGSLKWAKRASTSHYQTPSIISLYDSTSVLVGGYWGPTIFGEGELNETTLTGSCIFMARFNP